MLNKKLMILAIFFVSLLAVSVVSAADNADDVANITDAITNDNSLQSSLVEIDGVVDYDEKDSSDLNHEDDIVNDELLEINYFDDELTAGKATTYFDVTQNKLNTVFTVKIKSQGSQINVPFTYSFDGGTFKSGSSTIKNSFQPYSTHTLNLKYDGNWQYGSCTKTVQFQVLSSIDFDEAGSYTDGGMNFKYYLTDANGKSIGTKTIFAPYGTTTLKLTNDKTGQSITKKVTVKHTIFIENEGSYTDGGMNFKYTLNDKNGYTVSTGYQFAPFGESTFSISNKWTGESVSKTVNVKKRILETNDFTTDYKDVIEYKVRAADENDNFIAGRGVDFYINNQRYNSVTDENGYATLRIHLKEGSYTITTKYAGNVNQNIIKINPVYVYDKYKDMYIKPLTAYYGAYKYIDFGWKGLFKGYFKLYKGNSLITSLKLDNSRYIGDYIKYELEGDEYDISALSVGSYKAKIVDMKGKVIVQSTIKIIKTPTKIKVPSIEVKKGTKHHHIIASIYEKSCGELHWGGVVKFKINGKTYKVKVKEGKAKIKVKMPSKLKTYKCKAIFSGDKNVKSSSVKFIITVKKIPKKNTNKKVATKKKSSGKKFTLKLKAPEKYSEKKIKGNHIYAFYKYRNQGQYGRGVCIDSYGKYGPGTLKGIKLIKAKIYFKNDYNGKKTVKTKKFDKYGYTRSNLISGYTPYKVVVFYK